MSLQQVVIQLQILHKNVDLSALDLSAGRNLVSAGSTFAVQVPVINQQALVCAGWTVQKESKNKQNIHLCDDILPMIITGLTPW